MVDKSYVLLVRLTSHHLILYGQFYSIIYFIRYFPLFDGLGVMVRIEGSHIIIIDEMNLVLNIEAKSHTKW